MSTGLITGMDSQCVRLCDAMNKVKGIRTFESCCGHGDRPFRIWFAVEDFASLGHLAYWFMACHSGVQGWRIVARTDCGARPATFMAESTTQGDAAFAEADQIAKAIEEGE